MTSILVMIWTCIFMTIIGGLFLGVAGYNLWRATRKQAPKRSPRNAPNGKDVGIGL